MKLLCSEMEPYECDILGLAEMRWIGVGELNRGEVIWSGEEENHNSLVGSLLSNRAKGVLIGYIPVNSRIIAKGHKLPAKLEKLDDKVWQLHEAIQKAVKEVLPISYKPNKPWIKALTL